MKFNKFSPRNDKWLDSPQYDLSQRKPAPAPKDAVPMSATEYKHMQFKHKSSQIKLDNLNEMLIDEKNLIVDCKRDINNLSPQKYELSSIPLFQNLPKKTFNSQSIKPFIELKSKLENECKKHELNKAKSKPTKGKKGLEKTDNNISKNNDANVNPINSLDKLKFPTPIKKSSFSMHIKQIKESFYSPETIEHNVNEVLPSFKKMCKVSDDLTNSCDIQDMIYGISEFKKLDFFNKDD